MKGTPIADYTLTLLRQRNPDLHATSCVDRRRRVGYIRIQPSLVKIELDVDPVAQYIIDGGTDAHNPLSTGGKCIGLVQS